MAAVKSGIGTFSDPSGLRIRRRRFAAGVAVELAVVGMVLLPGCAHKPPPPAPPPPKVSVVTVQAQAVPITTELPGRVTGYRTADVRPQVNGIILKRLFVEGATSRPGSSSTRSTRRPTRPVTTAPSRRMPRPRHCRTVTSRWAKRCGQQAGRRQCRRPQLQAQSAVKTAHINLVYTRVLSPITGPTGRSRSRRGRWSPPIKPPCSPRSSSSTRCTWT